MGLNGKRHKTNLPLGKKNTIPVQSGRCFDLAQTEIKAVKKLGIEDRFTKTFLAPLINGVPIFLSFWQMGIGNINVVLDNQFIRNL